MDRRLFWSRHNRHDGNSRLIYLAPTNGVMAMAMAMAMALQGNGNGNGNGVTVTKQVDVIGLLVRILGWLALGAGPANSKS